jgi:hypothetical protein
MHFAQEEEGQGWTSIGSVEIQKNFEEVGKYHCPRGLTLSPVLIMLAAAGFVRDALRR